MRGLGLGKPILQDCENEKLKYSSQAHFMSQQVAIAHSSASCCFAREKKVGEGRDRWYEAKISTVRESLTGF